MHCQRAGGRGCGPGCDRLDPPERATRRKQRQCSRNARAHEAAAEADAATLDNVRDRNLRAAKTWRGLAEQARKTAEERVKADRVRAEKREADSLIS